MNDVIDVLLAALRRGTNLFDWTKDATKNGDVDEDIILVENQAPHTYNNSMRMIMSRLRAYVQDISLVKCDVFYAVANEDDGDRIYETLIRLRPKNYLTKLKTDLILKFRATQRNVGNTRIVFGDWTGLPVYKASVNGHVPLEDDDIVEGGFYTVIFISVDNKVCWYLLNPTVCFRKPRRNVYRLPTGMIGCFPTGSVPEGWLECDGSKYLKSDYPELNSILGSGVYFFLYDLEENYDDLYFHVPDYRGMFLCGYDEQKHYFGYAYRDKIKRHKHNAIMYDSYKSSKYRAFPKLSKTPLEDNARPIDVLNLTEAEARLLQLGLDVKNSILRDDPPEDEFYKDVPIDKEEEGPPEGRYRFLHAKHLGAADEVIPTNVAITYGIKI